VTSGTITNRLDRLESEGLLTRYPDPYDGRGIRVEITAQGIQVIDAALDSLLLREREFMKSLDVTEQETLAQFLSAILSELEGKE
jgi:DNA-binding MarR family transcriptional regulator